MKRLEFLIERSRRETENEEFGDSTGISDEEFVDFINDAQYDIQSAIARQHKKVFIGEKKIDVVNNQEAYDLPDDILLDNRVSAVWFSYSGQEKDYRRLRSSDLIERVFDRSIEPVLYIRKAGKLLLNPKPKRNIPNGVLINYVKKLPTVDIRRATIASVTTLDSTITALTLDTSALLDADELNKDNYLSVVNSKGVQVMKSIPFTNIDAATGVVTLEAGFTFETTESIAVGNYIVRGFDATNRSELSDTCERFLSAYCNWKIFKRDSSADSTEQTNELAAMRTEIVEIFKDTDDDVRFPPIEDTQFIDDDDLWNYY